MWIKMTEIESFYREMKFFIEYIEGDDVELAQQVKTKFENYKNEM